MGLGMGGYQFSGSSAAENGNQTSGNSYGGVHVNSGFTTQQMLIGAGIAVAAILLLKK